MLELLQLINVYVLLHLFRLQCAHNLPQQVLRTWYGIQLYRTLVTQPKAGPRSWKWLSQAKQYNHIVQCRFLYCWIVFADVCTSYSFLETPCVVRICYAIIVTRVKGWRLLHFMRQGLQFFCSFFLAKGTGSQMGRHARDWQWSRWGDED